MKVVRPFETDEGRLVVQLITLGPGLCAGDALHVSVHAEAGARVVVTTPAASRIMAMADGERASQDVRLAVEAGASLEYYPAVAIPFPGSTFVQTVTAEAVPGARLGVVEAWALGRQARGEYLEFARLSSRTSLAVDGTVVYADATEVARASTMQPTGRSSRADITPPRLGMRGVTAPIAGSARTRTRRVAGAVAPRPGSCGPWRRMARRSIAPSGSHWIAWRPAGAGPGSPRAIPLWIPRTRACSLRGGRAGFRTSARRHPRAAGGNSARSSGRRSVRRRAPARGRHLRVVPMNLMGDVGAIAPARTAIMPFSAGQPVVRAESDPIRARGAAPSGTAGGTPAIAAAAQRVGSDSCAEVLRQERHAGGWHDERRDHLSTEARTAGRTRNPAF